MAVASGISANEGATQLLDNEVPSSHQPAQLFTFPSFRVQEETQN